MAHMQVILRGRSAAEFWRAAAEREAEELRAREERWLRGDMAHDELPSSCASMLLQRRRHSVPSNYVPHVSADAAQALAARWGLMLPLQVHAANPNQSRSSDAVATMLGPVPAGHLIFFEPGAGVVSPEMCLADLARSANPLDLLMHAFELCGHFAVGADGELKGCAPRTTPADIAMLCNVLAGAHGIKGLRFAAKHVLAGSRSPRESALAALLALPHSKGGYALPNPQLNHEIKLSCEAAKIWGYPTCEVDGAWPKAKAAYEYQSALHDGRASRDSIKHAALRRDGWKVIDIGNGQITHEAQMDEVARELARMLGIRLHPRGQGYRVAQRRLFDALVR